MSPLPPHIKKHPPPTENSITRDAEWKSIEELGEIIGGKGLKKEELLRKGSIGCIHYGQIYKSYEISATETISFCTEETASKCIKVLPGDIVFTKVGENKEDICKPVVWLGKEPIYTGAGAVVIRLKEQCNPLFLAYYAQSQNFRTVVKNNASSTTVTNMSISSFKNIRVLLPPLPEQQRIVAFLDEAFHNTTHLTEKITRSLRETQKLKNAFLHQAFTLSDKNEWKTPTLSEVCEYDRRNIDDITLPYLGMDQIESGTGQITGQLLPTKTKSSSFLFNQSHVLFGRLRPYLQKVWLPDQKGRCSTEIFPIKPKPCLERRFLFYWLLRDEIIRKINATCTGTRMPRANMNKVLQFPFSLPPLPEQQRIVAFLDEAFTTIATLTTNAHNRLAEAQKLKNAYLQKAFESPEQILNTLTIRDPRP